MKSINVVKAEYIDGYKVRLYFDDGLIRDIDLEKFLMTHPHPQWDKYRDIQNFKTFQIEYGNVVWGKDWDLIFPVYSLYKGKI